jgi:hypothetical protein
LILLLAGLIAVRPSESQAQSRIAGVIEFYGVEKVSREALTAALKIGPGNTIPQGRSDQQAIEGRLEAVSGVQSALLQPVCCEGGKWILYVGVVERGAPVIKFDPAPTGSIKVADTLRAMSDALFERMMKGVQSGHAGDDLTQGHSLLEYPPARAIQEQVLAYAATHEGELKKVLRESYDDESRAIAAWALGYASDKHTVISDLVAAARDPYDETRNNAIRALAAIGTLAARKPELGLSIPTEPLLTLLRSPTWTDRNKTSLALMTLTHSRDPRLLARLKQEAVGPLVEMARWKTGHALAPYLIVGRMVGVSDSAAFAAFQRGDRESVLRHALH